MSDFNAAVEYVFQNEGGFINNPKDAGRATNFGISLSCLSKWRGALITIEDVKNLTKEEARAIYEAYFWRPLWLDHIVDTAVATAIFDLAVNRGEHTAVTYAQQAARVSADGVIGDKTLRVLNSMSAEEFILNFLPPVQIGYIERVVEKPDQLEFLKGWIARTHRLLSLIG